jgi:argininosuccinate lyase
MKQVFVCTLAAAWLIAVSPIAAQDAPRRGAAGAPGHDAFYFLGVMNQASVVMLAETGIVPPALASQIAKGVVQVIAQGDKPGGKRPGDYLVFEEDLVAAAGPDTSRIHTGRSRQDLGSTSARMQLREGLLDVFDSLAAARQQLLALAAQHTQTIIPAYTHGVQAQPTSLAHYLLALDASLDRDGERFRQAYARINMSPLGAAALGTSGFPLDRKRLATLLGFDGVVENSYDANHVSPAETNAELAGVVAISALAVGHFDQDLHTQYHQPVPWMTLKEGKLTGISSIMPQKRNPSALEQLRALSSTVIGDAQTVYFVEHNTTTGMSDYRGAGPTLQAVTKAARMYQLLRDVLVDLDIRPDRALAEVNADYSTMTEVADTLLRVADVPFRIGHHFASELTNYGRSHGKTPKEIPYAEAIRIYKDATGQTLPLSEAQFKESLSAENMVFNRHGLGGPQLSEVKRMQQGQESRLASDTAWAKTQRTKLQSAMTSLTEAFRKLITS